VLELDRGRSAAALAETPGGTRQSVPNWAATFAAEGDPSALANDPRGGRPPLLVVLAENETDQLLLPPLRAGGALKGEPAEVHISGRNARRVSFGAMNLRTGTRRRLPRLKGRAGDFQSFLEAIRWHYRGWPVAMWLDEDPSHTAKASLRLAEGMTLLWLPKRSPELNPRDTRWGQGRL
jgi:hypothetical protein